MYLAAAVTLPGWLQPRVHRRRLPGAAAALVAVAGPSTAPVCPRRLERRARRRRRLTTWGWNHARVSTKSTMNAWALLTTSNGQTSVSEARAAAGPLARVRTVRGRGFLARETASDGAGQEPGRQRSRRSLATRRQPRRRQTGASRPALRAAPHSAGRT